MSDQPPNKQDYESELKKAIALRKDTGNLLKTLMAELMILIGRINQLQFDLNSEPKNKIMLHNLGKPLAEFVQILEMLKGLQVAIEHSTHEDEAAMFETKLSMTQNPIVLTGMVLQVKQLIENIRVELNGSCKECSNLPAWVQASTAVEKGEVLATGISTLIKNIYAERITLEKITRYKDTIKGEKLKDKHQSGTTNKKKIPEEFCHPHTDTILNEPVVLIGGEDDSFGFSCEKSVVEGGSYISMLPNRELKKVIERYKQNGLELYASDKDLFKWELPFIDLNSGETFEKTGSDRNGIPNENLVRAIDRFRNIFGYK